MQPIAAIAGGVVGIGAGIAGVMHITDARRQTEKVFMFGDLHVEGDRLPNSNAIEMRIDRRNGDGSIDLSAIQHYDGYGNVTVLDPPTRHRIADWSGPVGDDQFMLRRSRDGSYHADGLEREIPLADRARSGKLALGVLVGAGAVGALALGASFLTKGAATPASRSFGTTLLAAPAVMGAGLLVMGGVTSTTKDVGDIVGGVNPVPKK